MITLFSILIGFVTSLAPDIIKFFQAKQDSKHELAVLELQMKSAGNAAAYKMDEIGAETYRDVVVAGIRDQSKQIEKASQWVVNMSASVRPVVTYILLIAFICFKASLVVSIMDNPLPWQAEGWWAAFRSVWGEEEMALLSGVICFWFGDRTMAKRRA